MSRLLTLLRPPNTARVAAANNCNLPTSFSTAPVWVHNAWTTHVSGPAGYAGGIDLYFVNGVLATDSEQDAYYDFYLRAGIYLGGAFFPVAFGGAQQALVSKSWGVAIGRANVVIPPNTRFVVTNRRVAADGGAAGSYNAITTTGGALARQDGILTGTDPAKDYTLGVGVPFGAKAGPVTVNGAGALTAIGIAQAKAAASQAYADGGINLGYWFGPAGAGQPGATIPGTPPGGGYGVLSGGGLAGFYAGAGEAGLLTANPPIAVVGGGGGFGSSTTASYGPSLITGVPLAKTPSVLLVGDSITAGYGSVDAMGDLNGSYGWYEQLLAGTYGLHKLAVSGESAAGWMANHTRQLDYIDAAIRGGLRPDRVVVALGTNDFLNNLNSDALTVTLANIDAIAGLFRARGAKITLTTVPPAVKTLATTNRFTTVAEQEPFNANFVTGGKVDQFNAAVVAGTIARDSYIDGSSYCRDTVTPHAFRTNAFGAGTAFCAYDGQIPATSYYQGIHPSVGVGIPYLRANVPVPAFA